MPRSDTEILNTTYPEDTVRGVALASAARTANTNSNDLTVPYGARGVRVFINVTAIVSAPSVVFTIKVKDPISGVYSTMLASAAIVGTGHTVLTVYPGLTAAANVVATNAVGGQWRVEAAHGNANSITYSVGFTYLT